MNWISSSSATFGSIDFCTQCKYFIHYKSSKKINVANLLSSVPLYRSSEIECIRFSSQPISACSVFGHNSTQIDENILRTNAIYARDTNSHACIPRIVATWVPHNFCTLFLTQSLSFTVVALWKFIGWMAINLSIINYNKIRTIK